MANLTGLGSDLNGCGDQVKSFSGWWFQTWFLFSIFFSGIILHIGELIFFKMLKTTNQFCNGLGYSGLGTVIHSHMGMDQYLLIPFLGGWTSIYQLFWCSPGVQGFDTLPYFASDPTSATIDESSPRVFHTSPVNRSKSFPPTVCRLGLTVPPIWRVSHWDGASIRWLHELHASPDETCLSLIPSKRMRQWPSGYDGQTDAKICSTSSLTWHDDSS